ncbi:flagellar protein FlgN [Aliibacillus thermotolerans]|uniref:Flagellar protein FlgN n=1 Tax=Aliibacillus thermotolerans TaxID=1834418 RepID=A0ABW0U6T0_9BACI|nr:flagellar protein FlgN [Aliibacillus thermotolerans]MDA3130947.1 hypothetical protein [Aliibacillus thermotolerans]
MKAILELMALLIKQHQELLQLSSQKTEWIKTNNMEELTRLLKEESKKIREIEQTETKRQQAVANYLKEQGENKEEATITELLEYVPEKYHEPFRTLQQRLLEEMTALRKKESLNRALIEESLQFVHFTLDMIQPDPEAIRYQHPSKETTETNDNFSIFDSKA